jgi:hypothetical protein
MRLTALLCMWLAMSAAGAAEVYRYVDPENGVEFSDTPRPGAERIVIPESRRSPSAPSALNPGAPTSSDVPDGTAAAYDSVLITAPSDEETVRDNAGNLLVSVSTSPGLQSDYGHRLQLLLDGAPVETGTASNFALSGVERGAHTLEARVLGASGEPLATSPPVTFYLHRASLKFKKPPPRPKPSN